MTFDPQTLPNPFHYESTGTYKQNTADVFTSPITYDALRPRNSKISISQANICDNKLKLLFFSYLLIISFMAAAAFATSRGWQHICLSLIRMARTSP